jgi:phosphomannomutase
MSIRFGTDGWRAVIAEQFTFENVRKVAHAIADYALSSVKGPLIVIGYDTRFQSCEFARTVADILARSGCNVVLSKSVVSTPAVSSAVVSNKAFGGVVISASHNPALFNGIKFKTADGCSAPESVTAVFEKYLSADQKPRHCNIPINISESDITSPYLKRLSSMVNLRLIRRMHATIVVDPMYGSAIGYIKALLGKCRVKVIEIHGQPDPMFGGLHPEPIEHNLGYLKTVVKQNGAIAGVATDGDGDRIGVVDDKGRYLTPHQVFPLILYYLCKYKGLRGKVVQAISLGFLGERIAADFSLPFEEVPVGFKYIANRIMNEDILIGGEESGGYGYGNYIPERDGILNSLMILEMLAATRKPLSKLVDEMQKKYGTSCYLRKDFVNPGIPKDKFVAILKDSAPKAISGHKIAKIKDYDGIEFVLDDGSWLLLRPSGTEPVIRVYAESSCIKSTNDIINWGNNMVKSLVKGS